MDRCNRLFRVAVVALLAVAAPCGCLVMDSDTCLRHSDCPLDRVCSSGQCVIESTPGPVDSGCDPEAGACSTDAGTDVVDASGDADAAPDSKTDAAVDTGADGVADAPGDGVGEATAGDDASTVDDAALE